MSSDEDQNKTKWKKTHLQPAFPFCQSSNLFSCCVAAARDPLVGEARVREKGPQQACSGGRGRVCSRSLRAVEVESPAVEMAGDRERTGGERRGPAIFEWWGWWFFVNSWFIPEGSS